MNPKYTILREGSVLETSNLTSSTIRFWNDLQRTFSAEGLTVIEYDPVLEIDSFWRVYIGKKVKKRKLDFKIFDKEEKEDRITLNEDLRNCFTVSGFKANKSFWNAFQKHLNWRGLFMPVRELDVLEKKQLQEHLLFFKMAQQYFPHVPFLKALKNETSSNENRALPIPIMAAWHHFSCYVDFLKNTKAEEPYSFQVIKKIFEEHFSIAGFEWQLPSKQLVDLLYLFCEQFYLESSTANPSQNAKFTLASKHEKLLKKSMLSVQSFFEKHQERLTQLIDQGFGITKRLIRKVSVEDIKADFFKVCMEDFNLMLVQELIDNQSETYFLDEFPELFQMKYGADRVQSIGEKMKAVIGKASIMDRIQAVADIVQSRKQPSFAPPKHPFSDDKAQQWFELGDEGRAELITGIELYLSEMQIELLQETAQSRWNKHLENLGNSITMPFYIWQQHQGQLIPQLNLLDAQESLALQEAFWIKRQKEEQELQRLAVLLPDLYQVKSFIELKKFVTGFKDFSFAFVQEQWSNALESHRITIKNRSNYRIRRMREFGILEGEEKLSLRKEIWLDEMLQIEEEVRPYILFVKKAFQAALPVRRSVEFDPYRHSHDGVEFDPMTVQNQEKWTRGEVMKTLRNKVDRGEVAQINTFCLDSSGSMDHEPMRNLFKILYLLILGLEDRKSYDSVHFFGTYFIETVNFREGYTDRSLLFNVLRKISTITKDEVLYGGMGGTNISDGVHECHLRIQDFVASIKEKNEVANIVSSLFVITDGEPSMGIMNLKELSDFIQSKREDGNVSIKGIYIKPEGEESDFIPQIFGENNYIETTEFKEAVNNFVSIMTATYKEQRRAFKWQKRKKKK